MFSIGTFGFYVLLFFAVYVQVFLLVTYIDNRKSIPRREKRITLTKYPSVTVLVPCHNEQDTIAGTIESLLRLRYPKNKLTLLLIDNNSTDDTFKIMSSYENHESVKVLFCAEKGKHVALNYGLENTHTDLVATLDADSFISPHALERVVNVFNEDPEVQSVVSSIIIHQPKTWVQFAQKAEYELSIYVKNMLAQIGGLHVTPGPFSVFRRSIFDKIGMYRQAHNTEDCEIAMRIQKHGYKIWYCADSYVYTVAPDTLVKLFKQRIRWMYGFFRNLIDYKEMLFDRRYAGLAFFTLPSAIISTISILVVVGLTVYNLVHLISIFFMRLSASGIDSFDPSISLTNLYLPANVILMVVLYILVLVAIMIGRDMARQKIQSWKDVALFMVISGAIAPFWIIKSMIDVVRSKQSQWK